MMRNCLDATPRGTEGEKKGNIELRGQERANLAMKNFANPGRPVPILGIDGNGAEGKPSRRSAFRDTSKAGKSAPKPQ